MMIEKDFDVPFITRLAMREKQSQQNYRPIIGVHKWFARRPGSLFRGLLLSEFAAAPLSESFFEAHSLAASRIADPFMGGGAAVIEANRAGCSVVGYDINQMAHWIVTQALQDLDLDVYRAAANELLRHLDARLRTFYETRCTFCGSPSAHVKYFLWVRTIICPHCRKRTDLFPSYQVVEKVRHTCSVFVCPECHSLLDSRSEHGPRYCSVCGKRMPASGNARGQKARCFWCKREITHLAESATKVRNRLYAIEYHCARCREVRVGRLLKAPDKEDIRRYERARARLLSTRPSYIPNDVIPDGDETSRLRKWGYLKYRDMFNARQLLALEYSCRFIARQKDRKIRDALATNLSDLLRYQNMLCRYDPMALKSLDIFSIHGYPANLTHCESNILGVPCAPDRPSIGSGSWPSIIAKFIRAKEYCSAPFETRWQKGRKERVPILGEWIGHSRSQHSRRTTKPVVLRCASATSARLAPHSLDAVLTDPPYFGNVQYAELMDFCYVWLRKLVGTSDRRFAARSTRNRYELTTNKNMGRGSEQFTQGLSRSFQNMARALKLRAPFVFTYHHNRLEAYYPLAVAILDAALLPTAVLPCPSEMSGSIHIGGTSSSIVDSVFVCRQLQTLPRVATRQPKSTIAQNVAHDVAMLRRGGFIAGPGDIKCITYGQIAYEAVHALRHNWDPLCPVGVRLRTVSDWIGKNVGVRSLLDRLIYREITRSSALRKSTGL